MKKIIVIIVGVLLVILLIGSFVNKQSKITASSMKAVTVESAKNSSFAASSNFGALVKNSEEAILSAQLGGDIGMVYVKEGDVVKKGQVLVNIKTPEITAQYAGIDKGVQIAQQQEMQARRKWDDYKPEEREQFKLQTEQSRAARAEIGAVLAKSRIVAPFDGIVSKKYVTQGDTVLPGTQIIYIVGDKTHKEVVVDVPAHVGNLISIGDDVAVENSHNVAVAKIIAISPVSDELSRKTVVRIALEEKAPFKLGEFVNVVMTSDEMTDGISVPKESIINQYNDRFVFVVVDEIAQMKNINIIGELDDHVIISGINHDDLVVVSGAHELQDGEQIVVMEE